MNATTTPKGTRESQKELTAARKLDERIRNTARMAENQMAHLAKLLADAKEQGIHKLLNFPTWQAYVADVAATNMPLLHAVGRVALVKMLSNEGLSLRGIALAAGVSKSQVQRDLQGPESGDKAKGGAPKGVAQTRSSVTDRTCTALDTVRKAVRTPDKVTYHDLGRLVKELELTLADVKDAIKERQEARQRHPSAEGTNGRTGQVAA